MSTTDALISGAGWIICSASCITSLTESTTAPEMSASVVDTTYITGIANVSDRLLILMDIESLMGSSEMGLINSLATQ